MFVKKRLSENMFNAQIMTENENKCIKGSRVVGHGVVGTEKKDYSATCAT